MKDVNEDASNLLIKDLETHPDGFISKSNGEHIKIL